MMPRVVPSMFNTTRWESESESGSYRYTVLRRTDRTWFAMWESTANVRPYLFDERHADTLELALTLFPKKVAARFRTVIENELD